MRTALPALAAPVLMAALRAQAGALVSDPCAEGGMSDVATGLTSGACILRHR